MNAILDQPRIAAGDRREQRLAGMIGYLRGVVLAPPANRERFHAIYVDERRFYLADMSLGQGAAGSLSLRMRDLFGRGLSIGASGILVAHNHPSGDCRPSRSDIIATRRLADIALALDIELLDHLIITREKIYSMRAGGKL